MTDDHPFASPLPRKGRMVRKPDAGAAFRNAMLSWILPVLGIACMNGAMELPARVLGSFAIIAYIILVGSIAFGFSFSIMALSRFRGRLAVLIPALAGLLINGAIIVMAALPLITRLFFHP